jgi:NAD(P)-dependent dehydrogenase (short-subunit alcohol dehydrogenase family)
MASEGASVVAADIATEAVAATVAMITGDGGIANAVTADVSDEAAVQHMIAVATDTYGRLDVLHNNAAALGPDVYGRDLGVAELDLEVWQKAMSVNLTGVLLGCKHAVPAMRRSGGGAIVNMSSTAAKHGGDDHAAYGVSKSAIESLTRYVASMYGRDRIRCNAVAPGLILSETSLAVLSERQLAEFNIEQALPWSADPADIAAAVVWLASDESRCITGQTIVVDSGIMVRRPLDTLRAWERALPGLG